ncbi:ArsR/SmtB family transcription factor [Sporolactobacillus terrae]|uniref:HTH-type transcriptional repressor AseR n=1 Tax=Sporolactobacillus terrae TaxID=269673 RepID=A0A5K7WSY5_9BACL|nr:metalloregulator ArsR/SmtB family transcription factor [Sporolactobacillus terrae]BBN97595.1 HTH-type transcriptional repressor AseR [Sporolactobacillus terrae]
MERNKIEVGSVSQVLKLLGDETRLTIIALLMNRDLCVCELQEAFDKSQPAISQHLRKLKDVGLVTEARKSQWVYYSLNKNSDFYPLIKYVTEFIPDQSDKICKIEKSDPTRSGSLRWTPLSE